MKERGILLPIFSLPSKYGIGDFGYEAYEFIDILSENHIEYWNILPIFYCEDLPYSPLSYYAIDDDYISLDKLIEYGLIDEAETRPASDKVIYDNFKQKYFDIAFSRFVPSEGYKEFIKQEEIQEFAEFMAGESEKPKEYFLFLQYIAYKEWMEIKEYANSKNVKIIGDMPVYPPFRSVDTKYHPENFEMKDGAFTWEAGTPPDYYNAEGQKWNSPVYNVEFMKRHIAIS